MPDRSIAPPFVKTVSFDLIRPEVQDLPNGVQMFFIPGGQQDVVKIELVFAAGRWFERKTAAANFSSQLISKGTRQKNSLQIATIFDQYGAHLEVSPGLDFVSVSVYALNKNLEIVLRLVLEILVEPLFPEKEFDQMRSVFIQNLKVNKKKTSYVASQAFRKNLYGEVHPYGREVEEKDTEVLTIADLREHFQTSFHSPKIFISGKIESRNKDLMLKIFGSYIAGKSENSPSHRIEAGPTQQHLEKKESVQSSVRMGKRSVLRSHPDYARILFVSHILGGYFGSRLMKNIREEKGLTYGISASLHGMKHDSFLVIGADVNKENTDLTFEEIRKELQIMRSSPISDDELETTRNHFIGSLQSEITTPFAHADKIRTIALYDLQPDHYQAMIDKVDKITPSQIEEISETYFHEDSFVRVVVG